MVGSLGFAFFVFGCWQRFQRVLVLISPIQLVAAGHGDKYVDTEQTVVLGNDGH